MASTRPRTPSPSSCARLAPKVFEVRHRAPVSGARKLVGVARNYAAHADERGQARPEEPVLFLKAPTALIGPGQEIVLPRVSKQVDYEGELAVVIGRPARQVSEADALDSLMEDLLMSSSEDSLEPPPQPRAPEQHYQERQPSRRARQPVSAAQEQGAAGLSHP